MQLILLGSTVTSRRRPATCCGAPETGVSSAGGMEQMVHHLRKCTG